MLQELFSKIYEQVDVSAFERLKQTINERSMPLRLTGVTSRNLVAWRNKDLFDYPDNIRVQLNFKEFLWIKIIQSMRNFGISLNVIKSVKSTMDMKIDFKQVSKKQKEILMEGMISKFKEEGYSTEDIKRIASVIETGGLEDFIHSHSIGYTMMDLLIITLISTRSRVGFLLFEDEDQNCIPWMDSFFDINERTYELWQGNHLFISFNKYLAAFIADENTDKYLLPYNLLSPEEKDILDSVRSGKYKSIEIRFNDKRKPELLKLSQSNDPGERIIDVLSRNDYASIMITQKEGKIKNITSHITKKLDKGKDPN